MTCLCSSHLAGVNKLQFREKNMGELRQPLGIRITRASPALLELLALLTVTHLEVFSAALRVFPDVFFHLPAFLFTCPWQGFMSRRDLQPNVECGMEAGDGCRVALFPSRCGVDPQHLPAMQYRTWRGV